MFLGSAAAQMARQQLQQQQQQQRQPPKIVHQVGGFREARKRVEIIYMGSGKPEISSMDQDMLLRVVQSLENGLQSSNIYIKDLEKRKSAPKTWKLVSKYLNILQMNSGRPKYIKGPGKKSAQNFWISYKIKPGRPKMG